MSLLECGYSLNKKCTRLEGHLGIFKKASSLNPLLPDSPAFTHIDNLSGRQEIGKVLLQELKITYVFLPEVTKSKVHQPGTTWDLEHMSFSVFIDCKFTTFIDLLTCFQS